MNTKAILIAPIAAVLLVGAISTITKTLTLPQHKRQSLEILDQVGTTAKPQIQPITQDKLMILHVLETL